MKKVSGVYKITNTITGDSYIGSSKDTKYRLADHRKISRWRKHPNVKLYQAFAQYGLNNFTFEIIEETQDLFEREQYWIDILKPSYNSKRAVGFDVERYKNRKKSYRETHHDEILDKCKSYYYSQFCSYNGEILTLGALSTRFRRQGIVHPALEAKKYLINE